MKGEIKLTLDGASFDQTERVRGIINELFEWGFFNIAGGDITVHFDTDGNARVMEWKYKRATKKLNIDKLSKDVTIEVK